jgi:hypothetical protein
VQAGRLHHKLMHYPIVSGRERSSCLTDEYR